jgi:hypothetical protein
MSEPLPERPDLRWLRRRAKIEQRQRGITLAAAQLAIARHHGFASWRALVARIDELIAQAAAPPIVPDELAAEFLQRVGRGDLAAIDAMLRATPAIVNAVGPHPFWGGRPQPLHVAIETNRFEVVQRLLRAGADVNGSNAAYSHWSPLLLTVGNPDQSRHRGRSRRALLKRRARIGLVEALAMGDDVRALRMLRRGRSALPAHTPGDGSLLMWARTPAAIDRLLALGVSIDAKDRWGATPMDAFARMGRRGAPLVARLAAHGLAVDAATLARLGDRRALARRVAADPAVAQHPAVVMAAVEFGHRALAGWLLERGADPNARSADRASNATLLHAAAWRGDLPMVELLLARGADPELVDDEHRNTPAGWADVALTVTNNPACADVAARLREASR